jgi:hypothetical protein
MVARPLRKSVIEGAQRRRAGEIARRANQPTVRKSAAVGQILFVELDIAPALSERLQVLVASSMYFSGKITEKGAHHVVI